MEHFRVLPTDDRFRRLTPDQIELLFLSHVMMPDTDGARQQYQREMVKREEWKNFPKEQFEGMGYSEEDIRGIFDEQMAKRFGVNDA